MDINATAMIAALCVVSGFVGWGVIELAIWFASFVSVSFG